jgi:hypothetical protein
MTESALVNLLKFVERLEASKTSYRLLVARPDAVLVEVAVPGERWEVEFFDDLRIEIERFVSDGVVEGESWLDKLWQLTE